MKKNYFLFTFLIVLFHYSSVIAQAKQGKELLDSLEMEYKKYTSTHKESKTTEYSLKDTTFVNLLNSLSRQQSQFGDFENAKKNAEKAIAISERINFLAGKGNGFSVLGTNYYYQNQYPLALNNYFKCLKIRTKTKDKLGQSNTYRIIGTIYSIQNDYKKAKKYFSKSLSISTEIGDQLGIAMCNGELGIIYQNQGNFPEALKYYFKQLRIYEQAKDKERSSNAYNNIGNVFAQQLNFKEAIKYQELSLSLRKELGNPRFIASNYQNLGLIYLQLGNHDKAFENFSASLKLCEQVGDKYGMAITYENLGHSFGSQNNFTEALAHHEKALELYSEMGAIRELSGTNVNIGLLYLDQKKYNLAQTHLTKGLALAKETGAIEYIRNAYSGLVKKDTLNGAWKSAFENHLQYVIYKDSLFNEETTKKTVQAQMQYEFDKAEDAAKAEQIRKDAIAQEEAQKQKIIRNSFIGGFLLVLILALVSIRGYRQKRKDNLLLGEKNITIEKQKQIVEEKQKEVLDSINYAKRIQNAILPNSKIINEILPQSFVLYKPKDIVAGDFYWLEKKGETILFAACDCTGHGVPGAMVSVICNNGLNRSVREYNLTDPGKILDKTREIVIQEFEKSEEEVKDGMDVSLVAISNNTIQWSGANNPLWIIRNGEFTEYKANKQPIGKYADPKPFTTHDIAIQKGDALYIFTDGLQDQFGGEKGKKFKASKLKELLLSIQDKTMNEQMLIIENAFEQWKGNLEQNDDVCIIGVRI